MEYFVGVDWGTQIHRIAVMDRNGRVIEQFDAEHSGEGLVLLVDKLKQRTGCEPALVAIGIEVAWGALVETLVEGGFSLFSINPKQVDRFRDRFTVAGAKDDARDALVLASSLHTDRQSYRRVEIDSPDLIRLRELSRFQDELKVELRRNAAFYWATSSLCCDSRSRRQYDALRAAGHLHARALRGLADRLLGVLIALLKTQKHFDKARRDGTFAQDPLVVATA